MNSAVVSILTDIAVPFVVSVLTYFVCDNFSHKRAKNDETVSEICGDINTVVSLSRTYWIGGLDDTQSKHIALEISDTLLRVSKLLSMMESHNWTFGMDAKALLVSLRQRATSDPFGQADYQPSEAVAADVGKIANDLIVAIKTANHT